ncbi:MAG: hypothetical protein WCO12_02155 [bacterium]
MSSQILVCTQCGYVGKPKGAIKGNGFIEIILWLFLIIPGVIYSIWRSSSRYKICPKCKSSNLIPTDSPRAKTIMAESTITAEEVIKMEETQDNKSVFPEFLNKKIKFPKYLEWLSWCRKHWILSVVIAIFALPILIGMITSIFISSDSTSAQQEVVPSKPIPSLTERLKKTNNDPYWTSNKQEDYSSLLKMKTQSLVLSTYANDVIEGQKSSSDVDKKLASDLKQKLVAKQILEYPKMRKAYTEYAHDKLWEQDVDVTSSGVGNTSSGVGNTSLTLVGSIFASNKSISTVENSIDEMVKELRFKRINYKWIQHEEEYQYFDLKTPSDGELIPISL